LFFQHEHPPRLCGASDTELEVDNVPAAVIRADRVASILHAWRRKFTPWDDSHLGVDANTEVLLRLSHGWSESKDVETSLCDGFPGLLGTDASNFNNVDFLAIVAAVIDGA
jgi:hypothetical protein